MKVICNLLMVLTLVFAVTAAEVTGTDTHAELASENTSFWNTTGHSSPTYAYARLTLAETDVDVATSSVVRTSDCLAGGKALDARIYYPSVLSSSLLFTSFPAGLALFLR